MLRFSGCSLILLYIVTVPLSAEKMSFRPSDGLEMSLDWSDPTIQQAVISAAPIDWHDTPGADVWWVSVEGQRVQVQVFSALERPGAGEPNCCLLFVVGDSEFWLKVKAVSSLRPAAGPAADHGTSQSSGQNGQAPVGGLETLMPITPWLPGAIGDPLFNDEPVVLGPVFPEDSFASSGSGSGGDSQAERLESEGGSTGSEFVVAQVPEPAIVVLMGLGAAAALGRGRTRSRTIRQTETPH